MRRSRLHSSHRLYLFRPPSLVKPRFKRTVETQDRIPSLAGDGLHPIVFLVGRSLRSEINIYRTIRIDQQPLRQAADRGELLIGLEHGACLVVIQRERPEGLGGDVGWHMHSVRLAAVKGTALGIYKRSCVLRTFPDHF